MNAPINASKQRELRLGQLVMFENAGESHAALVIRRFPEDRRVNLVYVIPPLQPDTEWTDRVRPIEVHSVPHVDAGMKSVKPPPGRVNRLRDPQEPIPPPDPFEYAPYGWREAELADTDLFVSMMCGAGSALLPAEPD